MPFATAEIQNCDKDVFVNGQRGLSVNEAFHSDLVVQSVKKLITNLIAPITEFFCLDAPLIEY